MATRTWLPVLTATSAAGWVLAHQPRALAAGADTVFCQDSNAAMGIGLQLGLAIALLISTSIVHTLVTVIQVDGLQQPWLESWCRHHSWFRLLVILAMALITAGALIVEIGLWGLLYWGLGLIQGLEASLYFSGITFTTVGYGDMTLHGCWQLLSVGEAINGVLMAGWSNAQLVYVVQRTQTLRLDYKRSQHDLTR